MGVLAPAEIGYGAGSDRVETSDPRHLPPRVDFFVAQSRVLLGANSEPEILPTVGRMCPAFRWMRMKRVDSSG